MADKTSDFEKKLYDFFVPIAKKLYSRDFEKKLEQADISEDFDVYLSKYLFYSVFSFFVILIFGGFISAINASLTFSIVFIIALVVFIGFVVYAFLNPYLIVGTKVKSIKNNLSLAILGMSSVAESGAPPEAIFSSSAVKGKDEYITKEFSKITYYVDELGISLLEAISIVSSKTPSYELRKFLLDLKSNLESGGSLSDFMAQKAENARFEYNLILDNQNKKAEAFGDIYSAVVIAGPLFLFSGVMLLGMVGGGGLGGFSIDTLLTVGVFFLIPLINFIFLMIINIVG